MDSTAPIMAKRTEIALRGRFHLSDKAARWVWLCFVDTESTPKWQLYQQAGGKGEPASLRAAAGKLATKPKVKAAIAWLQLPRSEQEACDLEEHLERLRLHATTSMGTYAEVEEVNPGRATLRTILDNEDLADEEAFSALRRHLFAVRAKPWSGLPKEALQSVVAVKETKDGRVEIKLEPRVAAEQALARSHGWQSLQIQIAGAAKAMTVHNFELVIEDLKAHGEDAAAEAMAASIKRLAENEGRQ